MQSCSLMMIAVLLFGLFSFELRVNVFKFFLDPVIFFVVLCCISAFLFFIDVSVVILNYFSLI